MRSNIRALLILIGAGLFVACTPPPAIPTVPSTPGEETPIPTSTPTSTPTPQPPIDLAFLLDLPGSIAFLSDRSGTAQPYVMTPAGQDIRRFTEMAVGRHLAWSPDGGSLVFTGITAAEEGSLGNLFVISSDGSGLVQITDVLSLREDFDMPEAQILFVSAWSPDGGLLSFSLEDRAFVMNVDGSNPQEFAGSCQCSGVDWSPDGARTAFGDVFTGRLWVADAQGQDPVNIALTRNLGQESEEQRELAFLLSYDVPSPRWSPNGEQLAFVSLVEGNPEIYLVNADGTGLRRLTAHPGFDLGPVWSPDGEYLAFFSNRTGNFDIYLFRLSDNLVVNLTNNPAQDLDPAWSPAPVSPDLPRGE
ncbi:MAG: PD40 domain-containing protein [Chloroflexi bacterium]|nr:PD40 domain-containing protein [Chloroflexota bacterium]